MTEERRDQHELVPAIVLVVVGIDRREDSGHTELLLLEANGILVERLFSWPGAGRLLADAVFARDVPVVLGLTLVAGFAVVLASLAGDLVSAWLDPRLRDAVRGETP